MSFSLQLRLLESKAVHCSANAVGFACGFNNTAAELHIIHVLAILVALFWDFLLSVLTEGRRYSERLCGIPYHIVRYAIGPFYSRSVFPLWDFLGRKTSMSWAFLNSLCCYLLAAVISKPHRDFLPSVARTTDSMLRLSSMMCVGLPSLECLSFNLSP